MPFLVPAEDAAAFTDQAELDPYDLLILAAGFFRTGVISGCTVTAQSTPDDTVAVASGTAIIGDTEVAVSAGNVNVLSGSANADGTTATAADANYYRYDLIVVNASGQKGVLHGTLPSPSWPDYVVNPKFPAVTFTTHAVLAAIFVPPTSAAIAGIPTNAIVQKDLVLKSRFHSLLTGHTTGWGGKGQLPVGLTSTTGTNLAVGANDTILMADSAQTEGLKWVASATPSTQASGDAAAVGTADTFTRGDHKHGMPDIYIPVVWASPTGTAVTATAETDTPPVHRWYNRTGRTLTLANTSANATAGPSGSTMTIDINYDGTTVYTSTKLVLPDTTGAASTITATGFATTAIADGHYLSMNVDTTGGGNVKNLVVTAWLKG